MVLSRWRTGRRFGYPICCIAMFCWDVLWNFPPALTRCGSQGVQDPTGSFDYVACGVFHAGGSPLVARQRIAHILRFWLDWLAPRSPLWRRRPQDPQGPRPPWIPLPPSPSEWRELEAGLGPLGAAFAELDRREPRLCG